MLIEPLCWARAAWKFYSTHLLAQFREVTARHGVLLIADEVMTGWGRTGTVFACEQAGISRISCAFPRASPAARCRWRQRWQVAKSLRLIIRRIGARTSSIPRPIRPIPSLVLPVSPIWPSGRTNLCAREWLMSAACTRHALNASIGIRAWPKPGRWALLPLSSWLFRRRLSCRCRPEAAPLLPRARGADPPAGRCDLPHAALLRDGG